MLQSRSLEYESRRHPGVLPVLAAFKRNSRLPPTLPDDDLESRKSSLVALLLSASILEEHLLNLFLLEEVKFLGELVWARGAYPYAKERAVEG